MLNLLKRILPHDFRQQLKRSLFLNQDIDTRLANLRTAGFSPTGIIDGGAYCGEWTKIVQGIWPGCPCLMVEPLPTQRQALAEISEQYKSCRHIGKALGKQSGKVSFYMSETGSGIVSGGEQPGTITVDCTTLDELLDETPGFNANFVKLDLQGYELLALEGARRRLSSFEVILLEASVLRIGEVPIFSEVNDFMRARKYQLYDVVPQFYRPLDGALWQMDVLYVQEGSKLLASRNWA